MAKTKGRISSLDDSIIELNDSRLKKADDKLELRTYTPKLKGAMRINSSKMKAVESLDIGSIETKLKLIANERKKADKRVEDADIVEAKDKFKKSKKKRKKEKEKRIRMMFANQDPASSDPDEDDEEESDNDGENSFKKNKDKKDKKELKPIIDDIEGTTLNSQIGKRFSPLYALQMADYELVDDIIKDLKQDLDTSPNKNMYRSSQTSNLLSALSQKRTLVKDMVDMAKSVSDLELKYAKEERSNKTEDETNPDAKVSRIGASIIKGLYDDFFEDNNAKKKKKDKEKSKKRRDEDDKDNDDDDYDKVKDMLAKRVAKKVKFTDYERNIDIEGEYSVAVLADADHPEKDYKFIILDEDGERDKELEKDRPELLPKVKSTDLEFSIDKLKVKDKLTKKKWDLILKRK